MSRAFRFLCLIVLSAYLTGCGSDTSSTVTPDVDKAAKDAAAQMPPPPGGAKAKHK